jgi:hypothetical protein
MANAGWIDKATVWCGTEAGSVGDGTGTGKTNVNELTIVSIVYATKQTDDILVLKDGTDTSTVLKMVGPGVVNFGNGKKFSGLYVDSISADSSVYIFTK